MSTGFVSTVYYYVYGTVHNNQHYLGCVSNNWIDADIRIKPALCDNLLIFVAPFNAEQFCQQHKFKPQYCFHCPTAVAVNCMNCVGNDNRINLRHNVKLPGEWSLLSEIQAILFTRILRFITLIYLAFKSSLFLNSFFLG